MMLDAEARRVALIVSGACRLRRVDRELVGPAVGAAILDAGGTEEQAEREAERVLAQFWGGGAAEEDER